jgi:hypothetical protein
MCIAASPSERLDGADAAFVGALVAEPDQISGNNMEGFYTFRVERSVKGDLPSEVRVRSLLAGSACGFELEVGQRFGVALYDDGGDWMGGRCTQVDADDLLAATKSSLELSGLRVLGFGVIAMILSTGVTLITLETRRRQAPERSI